MRGEGGLVWLATTQNSSAWTCCRLTSDCAKSSKRYILIIIIVDDDEDGSNDGSFIDIKGEVDLDTEEKVLNRLLSEQIRITETASTDYNNNTDGEGIAQNFVFKKNISFNNELKSSDDDVKTEQAGQIE